jgi:D-serine deaminase-like pyridoxal phosphate-dependent protein
MLDHYFKTLNSDLKTQGIATPQLIVDDAALQQNIQYIQTKLVQAEQLKPRLVVKSLASLNLLQLLSEKLNTQRFMVFHVPHIQLILGNFSAADLLLGKPMPAQAARNFYAQNTAWIKANIQWLLLNSAS